MDIQLSDNQQVLLVVSVSVFYLMLFISLGYFLNREQRGIINISKNEPFLHLNLIRFTLLLGSITLPLAAVLKKLISEGTTEPIELLILGSVGLLTLAMFGFTFVRVSNLNIVKYLIFADYALVCAGLAFCLYLSGLHWFYVCGYLVFLFICGSFVNTVKEFLFFTAGISVVNGLIAFTVENYQINPLLFLFAAAFVFFVSLILFIKNNQRVAFSETILHSTKALVIVSNRNAEIVFVNNMFKETLGYSDEELLGDGWWKVRKLIEGEKNLKEKLRRGQVAKTSLVYLETKDKRRIWIQWDNNRLPNGSTVSIGTDVTEKQEKEREFKHIVENARDIIYTTNSEGRFTYINEMGLKATGYTLNEFYSKNFKDLIHPDHVQRVLKHNSNEIKNNRYETYIEFPVITKEGKELWLGQQIIFKIDTLRKKFIGAQAICRDISERVQEENQLSKYYEDLKSNYELKQAILAARTIESLADIVLTSLIKLAKSTKFITLNLIDSDTTLNTYYIDVFTQKVKHNAQPINNSIKEGIRKFLKSTYHHFKTKEDTLALYLLDQPKMAQSALVHEFKDGEQTIGFMALYTDFHFDFATSDTHFISDICNYIKTYVIEFEKNKIIERKNRQIEAYSRQLEVANENLETRNRFQKMVIQAASFDELNSSILKQIIQESRSAKSYTFNYLDIENKTLNSYIINRFNTFTFENKISLNDSQIDFILSLKNGILNDWKEEDIEPIKMLLSLQQPVINMKCMIVACIKPKLTNAGFIGVYSQKQNVYSNYELSTIEEIANVLQIALNQFENKQLIDQKNIEIEKQNKNLAIINEAQNTLINNLLIDEVFNDLLHLLFSKLNNIERASVLKYDFDKQIGLLHYISKNKKEVRYRDLPFSQLFILSAFMEKGIYDVPDFDLKADLNEDEKNWYYQGIRSGYAIPIYINNKIYASINLFSSEPGNFNDLKTTINQIVSSTQLIIDQLINKNIISEKNKKISDNINYAKRIQDAFLPNEDSLKRVFPKSFAVLLQRDALGGDFYWVKELNNLSLIAVGDCTGHGVSGALLSILATSYLNTIIDKWQNYNPGIILDFLSNSIYNSFHQKNSDDDVNDGLDISLCALDKKNRTLLFAGAMQTLYLVRGKEVIEYKGTRKPIGIENKNFQSNYDTIEIPLQAGDMIYMQSDGPIDQFSSATEKRLGNKRYKEILIELAEFPLKERKRQLLNRLNKWRANASQTDDICIVSLEIQ